MENYGSHHAALEKFLLMAYYLFNQPYGSYYFDDGMTTRVDFLEPTQISVGNLVGFNQM